MEKQQPSEESRPAEYTEWSTENLLSRLTEIYDHYELIRPVNGRAESLNKEIAQISFELEQRLKEK